MNPSQAEVIFWDFWMDHNYCYKFVRFFNAYFDYMQDRPTQDKSYFTSLIRTEFLVEAPILKKNNSLRWCLLFGIEFSPNKPGVTELFAKWFTFSLRTLLAWLEDILRRSLVTFQDHGVQPTRSLFENMQGENVLWSQHFLYNPGHKNL